jgi:hypothetical protein
MFVVQRVLILALLPVVSLMLVHAADTSKPIFVHAKCDGEKSAVVLLSLQREISSSPRYRLVHTLAEDGQMDQVLTINMTCTERAGMAAVATAYGQAKCFSAKNCHLAIDGASLRADFCDSDPSECGRLLFKAFDDYASNPLKPSLKVY